MAERFNQKVQLQPIPTQTGAAQGLMSVAQRLEGFKSQFMGTAVQAAKQRGISGAQQVEFEKQDGVTQAPEFKDVGFFGSVEAQAHNKVLKAAYLASLDNDNREAIARIGAENPDDLIKFNDQIAAYRNAVIKSVDPSIRQIVQQDLDKKIISTRTSVQRADIKKQRENAIAQTEFSANALLDDALVSARSGDLMDSAEKLQDLFALYDSQVDSGMITTTESQIKKRDAEFKATQETVVGGIKGLMQQGKFLESVDAIVKFREKTPKGFTLDEHDKVITALTSELNETLALENKLEDQEKELVAQGQKSKSVELFSRILKGQATANDVISAMDNRQVNQEQATKLINTLNTRGRGVDDWVMVAQIQDAIRSGEDMTDTIISNAGTNLTEATATSLLKANVEEEDDESILKKSSVKRAEGFIRQSMKVTGPFGALDQEAEKRLAIARRNFSERVMNGENEWDVADELVGKDDFDRAANPMFGNKQNLEQSIELLNNALMTNQIDDDTYNFEFNKTETLKKLRDNIEAFDKSKKEALNAKPVR